MNSRPQKPSTEEASKEEALPFCGIIMPIADMSGYEKGHWLRVREVLDEAIKGASYVPRLVSESEDTGIIHANIVQNLYDDTIVVCDVSGKNANVMFELGLRLAFDKPTIIVKDDKTDYSFDTSPIKHIPYRADLRFDDVREFQERVAAAITASVEKKRLDPDYSPFLKSFQRVKVTELETKEMGSQQFIIEQMQGVQKELVRLSNRLSEMTEPKRQQTLPATDRWKIKSPQADFLAGGQVFTMPEIVVVGTSPSPDVADKD
ncbi:RNA helicase [Agrobacterium tumefaciens]|uniref:RNA helicase n=1 Tax=Agrobacterium tumefaciens TaxID=358 RepID=UPI00157297B6|nr:RNA helicase [Agrobacterium tumefaciens]NTA49635.1 RNA helicase [Agrobacterium tumefaciens]